MNELPVTAAPVKVGDIFSASWGYDQTNVDYFQVVSLTAKGCYVREIASESVPGTDGFMCAQVRPVAGKFLERGHWCKNGNSPTLRRLDYTSKGVPGFNFRGRYFAARIDPTSSTYCSWYA